MNGLHVRYFNGLLSRRDEQGSITALVAERVAFGSLARVDTCRLHTLCLPYRFIDHGGRIEQLARMRSDAACITRYVASPID